MYLKVIVSGCALAVAAPSIASAAPKWCGNGHFGQADVGIISRTELGIETVLTAIVNATCNPDKEAKAAMADIDKARAAWGKKLGMDESDWGEVVEWIGDKDFKVDKWTFTAKKLDQLSPLDQYKYMSEATGDDYYNTDVLEPNVSQVARFGGVEDCTRVRPVMTNELLAPAYAICEYERKRFDPAKFLAEVKADTQHDPKARMYMRMRYLIMLDQMPEYEKWLATFKKEDPLTQKMIDLVEVADKEWNAKILAPHKDLVNLARDVDSAVFFNLRSGFGDCAAKTDAALKDAVSHIPAKSFDKMKDAKDDPYKGFGNQAAPVLGADPIFHMAATASVMCNPGSATAEYLFEMIYEHPGMRGPRVAALAKLATSKLVPDSMDIHLEYPRFDSRPYRYSYVGYRTDGGVIKSLKVGKDSTTIIFEKETIKQQNCASESQSNKVDHVDLNGKFVYEINCSSWETVTIDRTPGDADISAAYAKTLKVGQRVSYVYNGNDKMREDAEKRGQKVEKDVSAVIATWPNKTAALPNSVFGAPVK